MWKIGQQKIYVHFFLPVFFFSPRELENLTELRNNRFVPNSQPIWYVYGNGKFPVFSGENICGCEHFSRDDSEIVCKMRREEKRIFQAFFFSEKLCWKAFTTEKTSSTQNFLLCLDPFNCTFMKKSVDLRPLTHYFASRQKSKKHALQTFKVNFLYDQLCGITQQCFNRTFLASSLQFFYFSSWFFELHS